MWNNFNQETQPLSRNNPVLNYSTIRWNDITPVNIEFDDSYYSDHDGPEESKYVFLKGNRIPARWVEFEQSQKHQFSVIETGFGSGLNFFNVATAWQEFQLSQRPGHLTRLVYTSIEGFPLKREDLSRIISIWPGGLALTSELLDAYPLPIKGTYCFQFGSIELNLIFMQLDQALAEFEPRGEALFDCLFLDGFAPAKNHSMWHPTSLRRLSYLCKRGATFSTFTAASNVRRCLIHCGFSVTRQKGFGRKREMITGIMNREKKVPYKSKTPWYQFLTDETRIKTPVVIVGGGVAGCATAYALARQGIKSHIIEQSPNLGGTAGGLKYSLYSPSLSADFNRASQFYWHAFHHLQLYLRANPQIHHKQCGVFFIADNEDRIRYLSAAFKMLGKFDRDFLWLNENETKDHTGISINHPGLFTNNGGWLDGQQFCKQLANHAHIQLQTNTTVTNLTHKHDTWHIETSAAPIKSKHVVLCTGWGFGLVDSYNLCQLETIKGQTTSTAGVADNTIKTILNNGHYLIPQMENSNEMIVGASFEKTSQRKIEPSISADIENLTAVKHIHPALRKSIDKQIHILRNSKNSKSNSGVRLTTRDHLPLIGPVPDMQFYQANYPQVIQSGRLKNCPDPQYIPGLFVNTAHGSRGITASVLSGNIISGMIAGRCCPLPSSLYQAVHPARFFVRDQLSQK